ncbi:MAG: MFS transporter, partial [Chloroflexota bacterium]
MRNIIRKNDQPLYYGWVIAVSLAITETVGYGILFYSFSVFLTPMESELGWSRAQLTGGLSVSLLVGGIAAYPIGVWVDRHGARLLMTLGSICACICVIAWSQVTNIWMYYIVWTGIGLGGAAMLYEPAFAVIAVWFGRRRGTALAVVTFAAGLASTIFIPLSDGLLGAMGWRQSVLILGFVYGAITIPLNALVIRRGPRNNAEKAVEFSEAVTSGVRSGGTNLAEAISGRFFWLITLGFGLAIFSSSALRVHFIPLLTEFGVSASNAAAATGSIGLMQVTGRIIYGPLDNRLSGTGLAGSVFAIQAVAIISLLMGPSVLFIGAFVAMFGMSVGARTLARPSIIADVYGVTHYGRISSVMSIFLTASVTYA